jgi:GNAT superfamily N-acetyltransferase
VSDAAAALAFEPVAAADAEALVAFRIAAMRESLERLGRFDPRRARERFLAGFDPACTRLLVAGGERVGFIVVRERGDALLLDHLYLLPAHQGRGFGAAALAAVFARADAAHLPVRVGALRGSDSNRFYARHGFALVEEAQFDNYYVRSPA